MGKVELKKKEKQDALLSTAFDLFMSKGINKTSISDIASEAGVAKGTFYLYFKDKYDIRNHLISSKADQLFFQAYDALKKTDIHTFSDAVVFIVDHIVNALAADPSLLSFIYKHLSWGVFKNAVIASGTDTHSSVYEIYLELMEKSGHTFRDPEIMVYMIIELVSGTSYNAILYEQPVALDKLKPYLNDTVRSIINMHIIAEMPH